MPQLFWWHDFDRAMRNACPGPVRIEECGCWACALRIARYETGIYPDDGPVQGPWRAPHCWPGLEGSDEKAMAEMLRRTAREHVRRMEGLYGPREGEAWSLPPEAFALLAPPR